MNSYRWSCNVLNCGNGQCIHKITDDRCPLCGMVLIEVITTGLKFCSNHNLICDYEVEKGND